MRTTDVSLLCALVSPAKEKNHPIADPGVVEAIARAAVDPHFQHSATYWPDITRVAHRQPGQSRENSYFGVSQRPADLVRAKPQFIRLAAAI